MIGFYKQEPTLFDNFNVPTGIVKTDLIDRMLLEIGEMEIIYTNPLILKDAFGFWSRSRVEVWQKLYDIITYDYNPIWNVDGVTVHEGENTLNETRSNTENESIERDYTRDRDVTDAKTGTTSGTENITDNETIIDDADTINYISADNSNSWSNDTKTEYDATRADNETINKTSSGNSSENGTTAEDITDNDDTTREKTGTDETERAGTDNWTETRQGNIGVTMTQQLLQKEQELWENFDMYGYIIEEVKQEFCVLIW